MKIALKAVIDKTTVTVTVIQFCNLFFNCRFNPQFRQK